MLIFKSFFFALISALTLYIGNVSNLPPKRGGHPTPPTNPYLRPWKDLLYRAIPNVGIVNVNSTIQGRSECAYSERQFHYTGPFRVWV